MLVSAQIDRVLPIAGELQQQEFSYLLAKRAYFSFADGHLWFSIFTRPASSPFTRVQRCTCCFVLLLFAMLLNILYHDQAEVAKTEGTGLAVGSLYFTSEQVRWISIFLVDSVSLCIQIGIGVVVELASFIPSLLLLQMFRRLRPRHSPKNLLGQ